MNIRFIDTSVMMNLLEVPGRCADSQMIKEEFRQVLDNKEVLILPIATIIETGNHIAHISNGNSRRIIASKFGEFLRKTAEGEAPWQLYGIELDKEGLLYLADNIVENAMQQVGVGDMSIIHAFWHPLPRKRVVPSVRISGGQRRNALKRVSQMASLRFSDTAGRMINWCLCRRKRRL